MSILTTALWFLLAISILVAVHEFGHFFVARRVGVKVLRFSIGFGPRLLSFRDRTGTEFALSAIPLGGYVKMLDEREVDVADQDKHLSYNSKSVAARIAIAAAGPAANIVLAFAFYWAILMHGTISYAPVVGSVEPDSLAQQAGLEVGQELISIDGEPTPSRRDVALALIRRLGESGEILVTARYPDDTYVYESTIRIDKWMRGIEEPDPLSGLGLEFFYPPATTTIVHIGDDSAASDAGIAVGDEIVAVDGVPVTEWMQFVDVIQRSADLPLVLGVLRDGEMLALNLTPRSKIDADSGRVIGFAGIAPAPSQMPANMRRVIDAGPIEAFIGAFDETKGAIAFAFVSLKKLVLAHISIKNLSGPIGIAKVAADQAEYGFWAFVHFMAQISVILAVINMLPIPVLDGGHILFCIIEWAKGSPLSERVQFIGLQAGLVMVLCVMVLAFYNDILRL